jgi:hypothetical protein
MVRGVAGGSRHSKEEGVLMEEKLKEGEGDMAWGLFPLIRMLEWKGRRGSAGRRGGLHGGDASLKQRRGGGVGGRRRGTDGWGRPRGERKKGGEKRGGPPGGAPLR